MTQPRMQELLKLQSAMGELEAELFDEILKREEIFAELNKWFESWSGQGTSFMMAWSGMLDGWKMVQKGRAQKDGLADAKAARAAALREELEALEAEMEAS